MQVTYRVLAKKPYPKAQGLNSTQTHERAGSRGLVNGRTGGVPAFEKFEEAIEAGDLAEGQVIKVADLRRLGIRKHSTGIDALQMDLARCTRWRLVPVEEEEEEGRKRPRGSRPKNFRIIKAAAKESAEAAR